MNNTWRDLARPIIARVIAENVGKNEHEIRLALQKAFPWGRRERHPYKIWCDEINVQLGAKAKRKAALSHNDMVSAGQGELFAEAK